MIEFTARSGTRFQYEVTRLENGRLNIQIEFPASHKPDRHEQDELFKEIWDRHVKPLTAKEVARDYGILFSQLELWRRLKQGPHYSLHGRTAYYDRSGIERWLHDHPEDQFPPIVR